MLVTPMFAEDVGWVKDPINMVDRYELSSNGLTNMVKGQCIVMLVELSMRDGHTILNGLVITKHVTAFMHGYI